MKIKFKEEMIVVGQSLIPKSKWENYQKGCREYAESFKIYDCCDERFDYDILEKLIPRIEELDEELELFEATYQLDIGE